MNSSNKHGNYRRPEITRNNDLLAQDQRKILEYQRKQLENLEQRNRSELFGLINSKIYSNLQENADFCFDMCTKGAKATLNTLKGLSTPLSNTNKHLEMETDFGCLDKCMLKKGESFKMLLFVIIYFNFLIYFLYLIFSTSLKR